MNRAALATAGMAAGDNLQPLRGDPRSTTLIARTGARAAGAAVRTPSS